MTAVDETIVRSCAELSTGSRIEAWHGGRLIHSGRVADTVPSMGMFWILCERTGTRKLVDVESYEIRRLPGATVAASAGSELSTA